MIYSYKCDSCGSETAIMQSINDPTPKSVKCKECGNKAHRDWSTAKIHIPEDFKAVSKDNEDNYANLDNLKSKFKKSRPSGRDKIYY